MESIKTETYRRLLAACETKGDYIDLVQALIERVDELAGIVDQEG